MKKVILVSILLIPSLIYFFFELTEANFKKMAYYGPKQVNPENKKDTIYYSLKKNYFYNPPRNNDTMQIGVKDYPVYAIMFLDAKNKKDNYKARGVVEYFQLKKRDINILPLFIASPFEDRLDLLQFPDYLDSLKLKATPVKQVFYPVSQKQNYLNSYFNQKPYFVGDHFIVLVDHERHIRGYYDGNYISEVKRLLEEFKHLKLRDEHGKMEEQDKIERK